MGQCHMNTVLLPHPDFKLFHCFSKMLGAGPPWFLWRQINEFEFVVQIPLDLCCQFSGGRVASFSVQALVDDGLQLAVITEIHVDVDVEIAVFVFQYCAPKCAWNLVWKPLKRPKVKVVHV